jgi:4,5-DOPA dioxygenase extradiol
MKMPTLFIGHGSPMNALLDNSYTKHLHKLGEELPIPKAILVISAHWMTSGTYVSASPQPETIYDFYGFPEELYNITYPCFGSPETANKIAEKRKQFNVQLDKNYGLDHASWAVLKHMYPDANIPVLEMSIDIDKPFQYHFDIGKELGFLRDEGILIIGSGNLVHNLRRIDFKDHAPAFDWAVEADEVFKKLLSEKDFDKLLNPYSLSKNIDIAIPSPDHYIPMLYIMGMMQKNEQLSFTHEGIQNGSVSMRCFAIQ